MQNMGVDPKSSMEISNLSTNTIEQTAEKLKNDIIEIRFELKNDYKMPTIIVDKIEKTTKVLFHNQFDAIFVHPNIEENKSESDAEIIATINHSNTGKFEIKSNDECENCVKFIPISNMDETYHIDLNEENPNISFDKMSISLNGEFVTNEQEEEDQLFIEPRLFVIFRDGNGFELLTNEQVNEFRQYLEDYQPKPQIFDPKPLLNTTSNQSPLSHKFVLERFINNPPRKQIDIPSVLGNTLKTKLMNYDIDNQINQSCHIYRHLLQTPKITNGDIETAKNDIVTFENWLKDDENQDKLQSNPELIEIRNEIIEQKNKLKEENNLSPLELKLTLTAELERSKLNSANQALRKQEIEENKQNLEMDTTQEMKDKEDEAKGREIRRTQQKNTERASLSLSEKENSSYFENEPFLRDYEINQNLLEVFSFFIKFWKENENENENINNNKDHREIDQLFIETLALLKSLCQRLRDIISVKTVQGHLKILSLDQDLMINIIKNQFITQNIHNLLCCIGFALISNENENEAQKKEAIMKGYIPQQSNIFIDGGICYILSKLDEYHSKHKKYLLKRNNYNDSIDCVRSFEMDLKTKIIDNISDNTNSNDNDKKYKPKHKQHRLRKMKPNDDGSMVNNFDKPYLSQSASLSIVTDKPELSRCVSHCSCCPLDSPQRATKMDYLGRNRQHIISMDDLDNYPAPLNNKQLNYKYIETEGNVQRRVRTSSTFNTSLNLTDIFPTIVIQPNMIDFGIIKIGYIYRFTATITNHGNNQARFKVDVKNKINNENVDGIFIKPYYRSGGIAPGITIMLEIELCSTKYIGKYSTILSIKTQKYIFNMDVKAEIVEYGDDPTIDYNPTSDTNIGKKKRVSCLGKRY